MQTIIDRLKANAEDIKGMLDELLQHSNLIECDAPCEFLFSTGKYSWLPLDTKGKQLQGRVLQKYNLFLSVLKMLMRELPSQYISSLDAKSQTLIGFIEQKNFAYDSKDNLLYMIKTTIDEHLKDLDAVYDPFPGENIYVPDTNALLTSPNLEAWTFDGVDKFTVLLTPIVLGELDSLKIDGKKTQEVRDKAKTLIRKIKDYRSRGDMFEGVNLVDKNKIRSIAVEPDFSKALQSLNPDNNDDRLIATYYEVVREQPKSNVILVTADINMQNKAAFYGVIFEEPPELT